MTVLTVSLTVPDLHYRMPMGSRKRWRHTSRLYMGIKPWWMEQSRQERDRRQNLWRREDYRLAKAIVSLTQTWVNNPGGSALWETSAVTCHLNGLWLDFPPRPSESSHPPRSVKRCETCLVSIHTDLPFGNWKSLHRLNIHSNWLYGIPWKYRMRGAYCKENDQRRPLSLVYMGSDC